MNIFSSMSWSCRIRQPGFRLCGSEALSPENSRAIAAALLRLGEERANRMNTRAEHDTVENALAEVRRAEAKVVDAQAESNSVPQSRNANRSLAELACDAQHDHSTLRRSRPDVDPDRPNRQWCALKTRPFHRCRPVRRPCGRELPRSKAGWLVTISHSPARSRPMNG